MKFKVAVLLLSMSISLLSGCSSELKFSDIEDGPQFKATVLEATDNDILVEVDESEDERNSSDQIFVTLDVVLKQGITAYNKGDRVCIYYDGNILETYPAQLNTVYAIRVID